MKDVYLHMHITDEELHRLMAHAKSVGVEPYVHQDSTGRLLYASMPVKLIVDSDTNCARKCATIYDETYSKRLVLVEEWL